MRPSETWIREDDASEIYTVLFESIKQNDVSQVERYLTTCPDGAIITRTIDMKGWTALRWAAFHDNTVIISMLLQCMEIYPSKFDKRNMWEALRVAVRAGHLEAVKVILLHDKASDIDMGYSKNHSLLHEAAKTGNFDLVQLLLEHGSCIALEDDDDASVLQYAAEGNHVEVVKALLDHGIDLNTFDIEGRDALHRAAQHGHEDVVKTLLDAGADVGLVDEDGWTALLSAAHGGFATTVSVLMRYDDQDLVMAVENEDISTALHLAVRAGYIDVVRELLHHPFAGDYMELEDENGQTVLDWAEESDNSAMVDLLMQYREEESL